MRKLFTLCLLLVILVSCSMPRNKLKPILLYEFTNNGISTCTAFPITNRIILTAAHCLISDTNLQVILGENGKPLAHIVYAVAPKVTRIGSRADIARDIAIAVLNKEVNFQKYYKLPKNKVETDREILIDGYRWGEDRVSERSRILASHGNVIDIDHLGRKGVSGSPITYVRSSTVIAVFSSRNLQADRGFGALITPAIVSKIKLLDALVKAGTFGPDAKCDEPSNKNPGAPE